MARFLVVQFFFAKNKDDSKAILSCIHQCLQSLAVNAPQSPTKAAPRYTAYGGLLEVPLAGLKHALERSLSLRNLKGEGEIESNPGSDLFVTLGLPMPRNDLWTSTDQRN
jgi:hypothetical protein